MEMFNKRFVHFMWDDMLIGKVGFTADSIGALKDNINCYNHGNVPVAKSNDDDYPFQKVNDDDNFWKFFYYDPKLEVKKAYLEGKKIQYFNGGTWHDLNLSDLEDIRVDGLGWFDDYFEYRIKPEVEKNYRPFKDTNELIQYWVGKFTTGTIIEDNLTKPLIWVRAKGTSNCYLVGGFGDFDIYVKGVWMHFDNLCKKYEFLDGTPCGVLEE